MQIKNTGRTGRRRGRRFAGTSVAVIAVASLAAASASASMGWSGGTNSGNGPSYASESHKGPGRQSDSRPVRAVVLTPGPGDVVDGAFNVDVSLQAKNRAGNAALQGYTDQFIDPTGPDGKENPAFHPGSNAAAPGLVVTLSTTPNKPGTPLVGPSTNLAGVFQENSVSRSHGLIQTWNDWLVTAPGFFGEHTQAVLTVYAVAGTAPAAVPAGGLRPISNVVRETFRIG